MAFRDISSQRVVKSSRTSPWSYGWQPGGGWHVRRCDRLAQLIGTARNVPSQGFDLLPRWPMLWSSIYKNTPVLSSMSDSNTKDVLQVFGGDLFNFRFWIWNGLKMIEPKTQCRSQCWVRPFSTAEWRSYKSTIIFRPPQGRVNCKFVYWTQITFLSIQNNASACH